MIKNILRSIKSALFQNIALFLILTVFFTGALLSMAIVEGAKQSIRDQRLAMGNRVALEIDLERYIRDFVAFQEGTSTRQPQMLNLEWDMTNRISQLEYVKTTNITMEGAAVADIDAYRKENTFETGEENPEFRLMGDLSLDLANDFYYERKTLVEGRGFTQQEVDDHSKVAVISQVLVELNDLSIGDTISLRSMENVDMDVQIIGIYVDHKEEYDEPQHAYMLRANTIYMPNTTVRDTRGDATYKDMITEVAFFLHDPLEINDFRNAVYRSGIRMTGYQLNADDARFEKKTLPLTMVRNMAVPIQSYVLLIGMSIVLVFLLVLILRAKKDIYAFKAMGYNQRMIEKQCLPEYVIIFLVSLLISLPLGTLLAQPVGDRMIESRTERVYDVIEAIEHEALTESFTGRGVLQAMDVEPIFEIQVPIHWMGILIVIGIALFLAIGFLLGLMHRMKKTNPMTARFYKLEEDME